MRDAYMAGKSRLAMMRYSLMQVVCAQFSRHREMLFLDISIGEPRRRR